MAKTKAKAVIHHLAPVSERAIIQRINRKLKAERQQLKTTRGDRGELGNYYIIDSDRNYVVNGHIDLESYGRELGCLGLGEHVVYEDGRSKEY